MSFFATFNPSENPDDFDALAAFDQVEPAAGREPVPAGIYNVRVLKGHYDKSLNGKVMYKMIFEVIDGPLTGRRLYRNWTLTQRALPYVKRDLSAFGLSKMDALLQPFPADGEEVVLKVVVVVHKPDGYDSPMNDIKSFMDIVRKRTETPQPADGKSPFTEFSLDKPQTEEGK